jgi:hypothetical protein
MLFLLRTTKALCLLGFCTVLVTAVSAEETGSKNGLLTTLSATTVSGSTTTSAGTQSESGNFLSALGGEFSVLGGQSGDQVHPALALTPNGGVVTWEDNGIDKSGSGIGMRRLDGGSLSLVAQTARVNALVVQNQSNPRVAALAKDGLMLFVWESTATGNCDVYARILKTNNLGLKNDVRVNTYFKDSQSAPAVAALADGSAIIVWQSAWQDGCPNGIFARKISPTGVLSPVREFRVNQYNDSGYSRGTRGGRRSPAIALLADGKFVITWVSEQQNLNFYNSVDIYGRVFAPDLTPVTDEFLISSGTINPCANPAVTGLADGGFMTAWSELDLTVRTNSWDIMGRAFGADGSARGAAYKINTFLLGDQFVPRLATCPVGVMAVWTSLGQDGNREGVFGRFVLGGTQPSGDELLVNTTRVSQQMQPAVAWNGTDRFLVVWTSFVARTGFDLYGQFYTLNSTP